MLIANSNLRFAFVSLLLLINVPSPSLGGPMQLPELEAAAEPGDQDDFQVSSTLFSDRKTSQAANAFREEIAAGQYEKAVDELNRLQTADPHLLVPMANGTWGPVFLNVLYDFKLLPESRQRRMIVSSSGIARSRLAELLDQSDFAKLPEFWLRFPGTDEATQALLLMSRVQIDRGQDRAAEFWLKLVIDSGSSEYVSIAKRQLAHLAARTDGHDSTKADSPAAKDSDAILPRYADWNFRAQMSPLVEEQVRNFRRLAALNNVSTPSTWDPGLDSERAYQRTMRGIAGIDLQTGQPAWHYPISPSIDTLLKDSRQPSPFSRFQVTPSETSSFLAMDGSVLASVFCRDEVQTRAVVSQGRVFFAATDWQADRPVISPNRLFGGRFSNAPPFRPGQLIALDAQTGRRIWTVGRATLEQHLGPGDFGVWFFGPPCVTSQAVVTVFEWKGEIRIGRFSIETGQYLSSTPISIPEQSIDKDVVRTSWASTPVRDGGLLWSTTSTGWLLCLDESTMSVLWASRLADESSLRSADRVRRGQAAAITAQLPLNRRWNRSLLHLSGDRMLVLSQEAHEAILLDSRTGHRIETVKQSFMNLLFSDERIFVLMDMVSIRCFGMQDGKEIWKTLVEFDTQSSESSGDIRPTGKGVRRDNQLLLPLSDGYLATVDLKSGKLEHGNILLLPPNGWGHLKDAADGGLLYAAADQLTRLSISRPTKPSIEHLSFAVELLAAGETKKALSEVRQVAKSDRDFRAARKLEFDCLFQLARQDSQQYLRQLRDVAQSTTQQAQLGILESALLIDEGRQIEAISSICSLLQKPASAIHLPVSSVVAQGSKVGAVQFPDGKTQFDVTELTASTWAASELSKLLAEVDAAEWPLEDLELIPVELLCDVSAPAAADLVRQQVLRAESPQSSFELFQHCVRLADAAGKKSAGDYKGEIDTLNQLLKQVLEDDADVSSVPRSMVRNLLAVTLAELPESFVEAMRAAEVYDKWKMQWPDRLRSDFLQASREWSGKWNKEDWNVVPIRARFTKREFGRVSIVDQKDVFLNLYQWGLTYGANGRFFSSPALSDEESSWDITLSESINHSSSSKEWVSRSDSTLLLISNRRLTAISILNGGVLWSIPIAGQSSHDLHPTFREYHVRNVARPGTQRPPSWRLLTAGNGCVVTDYRGRVQIRRLLTGDLLWTVAQSSASAPAVAGPAGTLLFAGEKGKSLSVDVKSGATQPADLTSAEQSRVMCQTKQGVVVWGGGDQAGEITWKDPVTGVATRSLSLTSFQLFQFVGSTLLASVNEVGDLWLIDLETGKVQKFQIPSAGEELPAFSRQKFALASDHYLYVAPPASDANNQRRSPYLQTLEFDKKLFVLDRKTGELVSTVKADGGSFLVFEDPRFPLMLIGSQLNRAPNSGPLVIRGYDASGRKKQFDGRFPLSYGLSQLYYQTNQLGSFDLTLDNSSFRIQAARSP